MSKAKQAIKNVDDLLSDSDVEVAPKKKTTVAAKTTKKPVKADSDEESSEIDLLTKKQNRGTSAKNAKTVPAKNTKKVASPSDSDDEPVVPKKAPAKVVKKPVAPDSDDESEEVVKPKGKAVPAKTVKKPVTADSDDESEEVAPKKTVPAKTAKKPVAADSDDESEEVAPKKTVPAKKTPAKTADSDEESEEVIAPKTTNGNSSQSTSDCAELFVKNLPWSADDNGLASYFGKYGNVISTKVLYDRNTGKARGIGFVGFSNRSEAQKAIDDAANLSIDGRQLTVAFSDNKDGNKGGNQGGYGGNQGGYGGNQGGYGGNQGGYGNRGGNQGGYQKSDYGGEKFTAFVGNLGFKTSEQTVQNFFSDCGNVVDIRIAKDETGRSKGFAHIDFDSNDAVEKAKSKAGQQLDGREVRVDASTPRGGSGGSRGGSRKF